MIRWIISRTMEAKQNGVSLPVGGFKKELSLKKVSSWIKEAWDEVAAEFVEKCFTKYLVGANAFTAVPNGQDNENGPDLEPTETDADDELTNSVNEIINGMSELGVSVTPEDVLLLNTEEADISRAELDDLEDEFMELEQNESSEHVNIQDPTRMKSMAQELRNYAHNINDDTLLGLMNNVFKIIDGYCSFENYN
jgi:hypothetical protein